ncbi:MAG: dihydrofolate reductase [Chloroflexi bacterium]|nr:dihydrofolate reductase [Chloroflexota bacterium]
MTRSRTARSSSRVCLDGFSAPAERADDPNGERWLRQWLELQTWIARQRFFLQNLKLGDGGETGPDSRLLEETFQRTGVSIMGKRMFDKGEHSRPAEAPFHTPVFVLTHAQRTPWERPGGTTFFFVNDGIESALRQARAVAGDRDIRIAGGAHVIRQYLSAGLVDEFSIALAPVFLGEGSALFDGLDASAIALEQQAAVPSPHVTHLRYTVRHR